MKNRKGFTLIELLAVIVILAIILLIAVPQVTQIINKSKADSFVASYKMVLKQIDYYALQGELGNYVGTGHEADYDLDDDQYTLSITAVNGYTDLYNIVLAPASDSDFENIDLAGEQCDSINFYEGTGSTTPTCENLNTITGTYQVSTN